MAPRHPFPFPPMPTGKAPLTSSGGLYSVGKQCDCRATTGLVRYAHGVSAVVTIAGLPHNVAEGDTFTFGRAEGCTACLDPNDLGISRLAGSFEFDGGAWWLTNRSNKRALVVVDQVGIRSLLAPGRRLGVDQALSVVVEGQTRRHELRVEVSKDAIPEPPPHEEPDGAETQMGFEVAYTPEDRLALVALFDGYLRDFPRYDPHPRSYAEAAAKLNWPRTTLVKRIEHLRTRLTKAGVPNLLGDTALDALAEYVLTSGILTREDLKLLP